MNRRPNRSAQERRLQYARAEARIVQRLLSGFENLSSHRGCQPSRLGEALFALLRTRPDYHDDIVYSPGVFVPDNIGGVHVVSSERNLGAIYPNNSSAKPFVPTCGPGTSNVAELATNLVGADENIPSVVTSTITNVARPFVASSIANDEPGTTCVGESSGVLVGKSVSSSIASSIAGKPCVSVNVGTTACELGTSKNVAHLFGSDNMSFDNTYSNRQYCEPKDVPPKSKQRADDYNNSLRVKEAEAVQSRIVASASSSASSSAAQIIASVHPSNLLAPSSSDVFSSDIPVGSNEFTPTIFGPSCSIGGISSGRNICLSNMGDGKIEKIVTPLVKKCPAEHIMTTCRNVPFDGRFCDVCNVDIILGFSQLLTCAICDYDLCLSCQMRG